MPNQRLEAVYSLLSDLRQTVIAGYLWWAGCGHRCSRWSVVGYTGLGQPNLRSWVNISILHTYTVSPVGFKRCGWRGGRCDHWVGKSRRAGGRFCYFSWRGSGRRRRWDLPIGLLILVVA